ncbi:MAG: helix-turn-helix domain-containing protein [Bacteroidota bacterium]|nr:helix-turn-helix domain-containing protein [Bacteroidota bacterium]
MEKTFRNTSGDAYPQKIFASQLITVEDLQEFKRQLLIELIAELKAQINIVPKKWLKSHEVRKLLKISPGTLQTLKSTGTIPYTKLGGLHLFDYEELQDILEKNKTNKSS